MDKRKSLETTDMCRNDEQQNTSKGETWLRGTNLRLPFDINVMLNLSIISFGRGRDDF